LILSFDKVCQHLPQKTFDQQTKRTRYTGKQQPTRFFATEQNLHLIDPALCEPGQKKKNSPKCRSRLQSNNTKRQYFFPKKTPTITRTVYFWYYKAGSKIWESQKSCAFAFELTAQEPGVPFPSHHITNTNAEQTMQIGE
jgi:hypothetical protein